MSPVPQEPSKRRRAWAWGAAVGLIVLGIVAALHFARERQRAGRAEIDRRLTALRDAGEPVTAEDLIRRHPAPPPEQDAHLILAAALAKLAIPEDTSGLPWLGEAQFPQPNAQLEAVMLARLESLALANHDALETALSADLDGAWVGLGLSANFKLDSRRIRELRKLLPTLLLAAVWAVEEGQREEAMDYLLKAMSAGKAFRSATLLHHLTRRTIESGTCDVLERLLNRAELTMGAVTTLESAWPQDQAGDLTEALRAVRCTDVWVLEQLRAEPVGSLRFSISSETGWLATAESWSRAARLAHSEQGYQDRDYIQILDVWAKVSAALDRPAPEGLSQLKTLSDEVQPHQQRRSVAWSFTSIPKFFGRVEQDLVTIARLRNARVALAILRWRAAHEGKLPESLAELVPDTLPAIPEDPFNEQPLRYRRLPQGFTVYSVGPDFTDNGGQRQPAGTEKADGYDVVFTVER